MYYWWYNGKVLYTISHIILSVISSEANYSSEELHPSDDTNFLVEEKMKQKLDKQMKSIIYEGEEGFFLSLKEQAELKQFFQSAEKVIQDANNS